MCQGRLAGAALSEQACCFPCGVARPASERFHCPAHLTKPQVEFFDPAKASGSKGGAPSGLAALFGAAEAAAAEAAAEAMRGIQDAAAGGFPDCAWGLLGGACSQG